ncbi:MAG: amidohydrolase [Archaeoglobaceae archaeon]|nr:amidohydrolase [Archaeoglobaceae archaeon]
MYDLIIYGGKCWLDGKFEDCNIGIKEKNISYIGKKEEKAEIEINASNCLIFPAFFNSHTHSAMTILRNLVEGNLTEWLKKVQEIERRMSEKDVYWGTMLACVEMLKSGTAGFADMYIHMDSVAKAVCEAGMRASLGYGMADRGDPERAKKELEEGLRFANKWDGAFGRIKCHLAPHSLYTCSLDFLKKVSELGYLKHIHLAETLWEVKELKKKYGVTPVKLLDRIGFLDDKTVAAHAIWLSDEEIEILAKRKVNVAHCPASNMRLGSGIAKVREMLNAGINVCLATDGAASNDTLNMLQEIRISALLQQLRRKPIKFFEIIKIASENGYKAYNFNGGKIEVGKLADLIIIDKKLIFGPRYENFTYSPPQKVSTVIIDGKIVVEDGTILTFDEEKVFSKVEKIAEDLTNVLL